MTSGKLFVLIITSFVDMVGLLMVLPLIPFYARDLGGGGVIVAVLVSSFTAAQLLSAPLWGRFSDKYGRRPALLIGLTAAAIAYIVFALRDVDLAAAVVAHRAGRRRRDGWRHPGVRRRFRRAGEPRQGTRLAVGGDKSRRRDRAGDRVGGAGVGQAGAGAGGGRALPG